MADVLSRAPATSAPEEFVEALNGLVLGTASLEIVRRSLEATLAADDRSSPIVQSLLDDAHQEGRLTGEDYEILSGDIGRQLGENVPTDWSEEVVREAAPLGAMGRAGVATPLESSGEPRVAALSPGAVLRDRFVLQSRLGASGMSEVYKALDRRRQEAGAANPWLAIKVVSPSNKRFREALQLLQREALLIPSLDHPNIVRVFDFDRDGDHAFLTMEWLEGESLADLLTRQRYRPLTIARARQILLEIGNALNFAHARGIAHADVKPGNIFLTRDGTAKLLDFGIAQSASAPPHRPPADARTPAYASCEVLEGQAPTAQDDVYSAACVAYRMLGGRRVFGHHDALAAETAGRRPARIRTLTAAQWSALDGALAFRREFRTPDMAAFLRDFTSSVKPMRAAASAAAESPVAPHLASSRPRLAWAVGAAALLGIAIFIWRGPASDPVADAAPVKDSRSQADDAGPIETPITPRRLASEPGPQTMAFTSRSPEPARAIPARDTKEEQPVARGRQKTPMAAAGIDARLPATREPPNANRTGSAPIPAELVAVNGSLLSSAAHSEDGNLPAANAISVARNVPEAPPQSGSAAQVVPSPAPAGPLQVPLSSLKFKRYVEPQGRGSSRDPDPAGWVELSFVVGSNGQTRDITIVDASPPNRYEEAALAAVKLWRFEPAREGGRPVDRRTAVRLRFQPE